MNADLVLTMIGLDRPGLVEILSETVAAHGANWESSRMARLGGRFAGILHVTVAEEAAESLVRALSELEERGLRITVEHTAPAPMPAAYRRMHLELVGNDRPGIIRQISTVLAERGVNVEELRTACDSAPMTGGMLLRVSADLSVPPAVPAETLRTVLESLASDLMVDLSLEEA